MAINFQGYLYDDSGSAIQGATVQLLQESDGAEEASTTTSAAGLWYFNEADQDKYDIKITRGSSIRYIQWNDQISLREIDVRNDSAATTPALTATNLTNSTANQVAVFSGANTTRADNDEVYMSFKLADSAGNLDEFARMTVVATDVTSGSEDGQIEFDVLQGGSLIKAFTIASSTAGAQSIDFNQDSITFGTGTAATDITLTFDAESADGVITWMEDEDYFKFSDEILMNSTEKILFGDTGTFIHQSADGVLTITSDTTVDINGAVVFDGALSGITTIASGAITSTGIVTGTGFTAGSAVLAEAELELLDGLTAGTAIASKVVTTDANIDTSGQRNLTITGELDAATLDISGNSDFDGTLDVAGNTVISAGTFTVGSDGSGQDVIFYSGTSGDNLTWDSSEEVLQITGTNGATALDVLDGDVRIVDKLYFFDRGGEYISSDGGTLTIKGASTIVDSTGGNFYVRAAGGGLILQSAENIFFDASQYFTWRDQDNSDNEILKLNSATATVALEFQQASTISTSTGILSLDAGSTSIRLNEAGADIDVFIESANNNKVFHTNAGTDTVGIGGTGVTESMLAIVAGAVGHNLYTQYGVAINVFADTFNDTGSAATDAIIPTVSIAPLTYTGTNANTYTNAVSLYIQGPPVASTNITITNAYALWVDAGVSRLDGAISLGTDHGDDGQQLTSGGDDAACDWTAASSLREHKNIGSEADAGQALQAMLDATPYHFRYKEKHGTGDSRTEYIGVMADDAPWAMHYKGTIVNPVNTLGYTVLAVQALNDKIERLESLLAKEA